MLDPSWRDLAGQEMPVAALCDVRDRAATILRELGYLAAVQVPLNVLLTVTGQLGLVTGTGGLFSPVVGAVIRELQSRLQG